MKKLGKLKIDKVNLLNNEELLSLRGGYGQYWCLYHTEETEWWDWFNCAGECTPPQASLECTEHYYPNAWCDCGC